MAVLQNPCRGIGLPGLWPGDPVWPSVDADAVAGLLAKCPAAAETPLRLVAGLGGIAQVFMKDETARMGLGSFKALGAAYAIAREAGQAGGRLEGRCYIAASAGNHGLSVAAGARMFGARAVIVLAETVPESFAERLRGKGACVDAARFARKIVNLCACDRVRACVRPLSCGLSRAAGRYGDLRTGTKSEIRA